MAGEPIPWPWVVAIALILEAALGYPAALHRRIPHPIVWAGVAIGYLDTLWNRSDRHTTIRRALGVATLLLVAGAAGIVGAIMQAGLGKSLTGQGLLALIATLGLAQNSLYFHVTAVLTPLRGDDLNSARVAVGKIVGRDTEPLDACGVSLAALESLAESFNDGICAPAFWLLIAGLPGLFVYKVFNTADSMIGHREPRWRAFGWAAARGDDLLNLIPARLAGGLLVLAAGRGWRTMVRDAPQHASPNAGWPEAAMAGALGIRLGGPASYDGELHDRPNFGDGASPSADDLSRGLRLYLRSCALLIGLVALVGLAWPH